LEIDSRYLLDIYIKILKSKIESKLYVYESDFDLTNYDLRRAFNDGQINAWKNLIKLMEEKE